MANATPPPAPPGEDPAAPQRALRVRMAPLLPPGLLAHIDRVVALAGALARQHGADEHRALLAAQGHDLLRAVPPAELLARAEARGLPIDPAERAEPLLLHGPLGALALAEDFGVRDEAALLAVRWHTSGHPDFDPAAWACFVADKVEPEKLARRPELQAVRDAADASLERAALRYLDLSVTQAAQEGWRLHPLAVRTRAALRERLARAPAHGSTGSP